jgi:hypothetical protein
MATRIRDEEYTPMIVVDPKVKTLLICPVCGAAVNRAARSTHTAWHARLDRPGDRAVIREHGREPAPPS